MRQEATVTMWLVKDRELDRVVSDFNVLNRHGVGSREKSGWLQELCLERLGE